MRDFDDDCQINHQELKWRRDVHVYRRL